MRSSNSNKQKNHYDQTTLNHHYIATRTKLSRSIKSISNNTSNNQQSLQSHTTNLTKKSDDISSLERNYSQRESHKCNQLSSTHHTLMHIPTNRKLETL